MTDAEYTASYEEAVQLILRDPVPGSADAERLLRLMDKLVGLDKLCMEPTGRWPELPRC